MKKPRDPVEETRSRHRRISRDYTARMERYTSYIFIKSQHAKNIILPDRVLLHVGQGSTESLSFSESCFLCPTAAVMVVRGSYSRRKSFKKTHANLERTSTSRFRRYVVHVQTSARHVGAFRVSRAADIAGANGPVRYRPEGDVETVVGQHQRSLIGT